MNVLQAHKYYWHRDGASNYALYLSDLLIKDGHHVIPFAMQHDNNLYSPYSRFFVSQMDLDDPHRVSLMNKIRFAGRMIYSYDANRNITQLLKHEKIDIVHLHNIYHHITPSILPVLKKHGAKIVMTLHDYKLLAPNYTMYHHGAIHEEDARGYYLSCIKNKCMKDSRAQSLIVTAEMIFHHKIMKYYERYVDRFIAPSQFIMDTCIDMGWAQEKFIHIPHPIDTDMFRVAKSDEGYIAYVGRLSEEKGLDMLLSAMKYIPDIPCRLVGNGPMYDHLKRRITKEEIHNVTLDGFKSGDELYKLIAGARVLVLPSVWYENYPLSILEAKAMGKLVIGSDIGGIPELLPDDMLCTPSRPKELSQIIERWFDASTQKRSSRSTQLRAEVETINDPQTHITRIEELYQSL